MFIYSILSVLELHKFQSMLRQWTAYHFLIWIRTCLPCFWSHLKSLVHKKNLSTPPSLKVGTGPTLASKLTMDILAWSFIASLGLLAAQPSVLVMMMVTLMMMMWWCFTINFLITQMALLPGLLLGLTSICAHNWFHLSDHTAGLRRFLYFFSLFLS